MKFHYLLPAVLAAGLSSAPAATTEFELVGKAGAGLLPGNENHVVNGTPPGTGGVIGAGIFFDDVSRVLTINVGWGSGNGFTDLTGNATMAHIHGPTADGGTASFTQNAGVRYDLHTLPGWNASAVNGVFTGTVTIAEGDVQALLDGRMYINVHTAANGPGEIRGNLVVVPEPGAGALVLLGAAAFASGLVRRRR